MKLSDDEKVYNIAYKNHTVEGRHIQIWLLMDEIDSLVRSSSGQLIESKK